ncbi:hypothetical protein DL766_005136 [Monosporascus sp. MC13-8B]|uniref:Enoyl reductase (ER) domain-containing protein n=1 Tax=Monosporascus cannonballus TaxID=155416 RepID=A0ABY0HEG0_9PEZI|nr:hypothetical protein DL762_003004 [Monosporascus cannonballus]RYO96096.1 hypothetical protein DL763_003386 [Monosporascus cannonballus]RYP29937.1 hypothetical protein DL766_005136 [Monosporascus sp. MC13-8B]
MSRIAAYMDVAAHKNSGIRIIEVGAGTGSSTSLVIEVLSCQGKYKGSSPRYDHYDYTDISPSFFAKAQKQYADRADRMQFRTLNVERDPVEKGFAAVPYDVVISVAETPLAVLDPNKTVTGGRLVLSEPYQPWFSNDSLRLWVSPGMGALSPAHDKGLQTDSLGHTGCEEIPQTPEAAMISPFVKTITREKQTLSYVYISVQPGPSIKETVLRVIDHIRTILADKQEADLRKEEGIVYIPRTRYRPLELRFSPGSLDSFQDASAPLPLQGDEIRVLVKATGINFKDAIVSLNQISGDHIGQEFAGVVTDASPKPEIPFRPGDVVCGIAHGSFRTYVRVRKSHVMKIPPGMAFTETCAIPLAYASAQYGLCHLARLSASETILIHAAAGAVGQAAIQIAQRLSAQIYVSVSTPEKKKLLMDGYGIQVDRIFQHDISTLASRSWRKRPAAMLALSSTHSLVAL